VSTATANDTPHPWMSDAACAQVGTDVFFPEKGDPATDARAVCETCDVRLQCLNYALANDEQHGVWGGLTTTQRKALRRRQGLPATSTGINHDRLRALHKQGLTGPQIASRMGCSDRAVTRALGKLGLATPHQELLRGGGA
jgi:WhiB family redox-sensing transcriptional regulator